MFVKLKSDLSYVCMNAIKNQSVFCDNGLAFCGFSFNHEGYCLFELEIFDYQTKQRDRE